MHEAHEIVEWFIAQRQSAFLLHLQIKNFALRLTFCDWLPFHQRTENCI